MKKHCILTGKASIDKPWMKYYLPEMANIQIPECTINEYLVYNCPGLGITAMHYYDRGISWREILTKRDAIAASLRAVGFGEGDQIPVYLRLVPEFVYLLLAAEKIGASLLCRDNTLEENVEAAAKAGAKTIIAHNFLSQEEKEAYLKNSSVETIILVDPCRSGRKDTMPDYIVKCLESNYPEEPAHGEGTMFWDEFLLLGKNYTGVVDAPVDVNRPLLRAYTSGSTGPSKQVIHSAKSMLGVIHQMNFYGASDTFRPTWLVTVLPPALVAVVVSMVLMPLASRKLLILDPFCEPEDIDLELMRYRPNCWPLIPMFMEIIIRSKRIPADYDMSHLFSAGVGCEAYNNTQLKRAQAFLKAHNCNATVTVGYGCSEAGSNITLPMSGNLIRNGNVGIPMPLTTVGVFKFGTQEEVGYHEQGEICMSGPGCMLGYDNLDATNKAIQIHEDGTKWLHMGDLGYIDENGELFILTRGSSPRFGGGDLRVQPMENLVADANIKGIVDEFFVVAPDKEHSGYFLPYLYVVLEDGYTVEDIAHQVYEHLEAYMRPVKIIALPERPFFHFKTNRIGLIKELANA